MTSPVVDETEKENISSVFSELSADQDSEITEIESLCMQCQHNGTTRLLLTKIPFYKEVVIMSFSCHNCHWENNELQPASKIQEKGIVFKLQVKTPRDMTRVVVKTEWSSVMIPELEFEIPSQTQEGSVTNVEGIIERSCSGIESKLEFLKIEDPESATKLIEFLGKLAKLRSGNEPFTLILRDCSGNSYLENMCVHKADPQLEVTHFERSREENLMLGCYILDADGKEIDDETENSEGEKSDLRDEVLGLLTNCSSCNAPCVTNMKLTQIPHFKDVVIMSTMCDACGYKTNEVKSGSGIDPLGVRFTLKVEELKDLSRDVLKSDTCRIFIKELELDVGPAAFGSRYTTVEGILTTIKEQLVQSNPFITGDSADKLQRERMEVFLEKIDEVMAGKRKVTLVLDDLAGNSYLQSIHYPNPESNLTIEKYKRTMEQDDELGLLDMKVENYEES